MILLATKASYVENKAKQNKHIHARCFNDHTEVDRSY